MNTIVYETIDVFTIVQYDIIHCHLYLGAVFVYVLLG